MQDVPASVWPAPQPFPFVPFVEPTFRFGAPMSQSPTQNTAVELDASDLPVFCPNPKMTLWSQHPRVYLDVTHEGQARCPYCSTLYRLKPGVKLPHGH